MTSAYHCVSCERMDRRGMLFLGAHLVSPAADRTDVAGGVLGGEFGAQAGDTDVEAVVADVGVESPGGLDELRTQYDLSGAAHKELHEDVLLVREQNGAAAAPALVGGA